MNGKGPDNVDHGRRADSTVVGGQDTYDVTRSIRPTIFDVYADPTIIMPIVLANLLSETLWSSAVRLGAANAGAPFIQRITAMQRHLDRWLEHLTPAQVIERDGLLDLDIERERLGSAVVDAALDRIRHTIAWRTSRGTLPEQDPLLAMIDRNHFPEYVYGTIDELVAHQRHLGHRRGHPHGLSSCMDEAALFASLLLTQPVDDISGAVILGSAAHYSVLVWSGEPERPDFEAGWFYGKNSLITVGEYSNTLAEDYRGDIHLAFNDRLPDLEFVVSRRGSWFLPSRMSSLPAEEEERVIAVLDRFFGGRLASIEESLRQPAHRRAPSEIDVLVEECVEAGGRDGIQRVLTRAQTPAARQVLACHRDVGRLGLEAFAGAVGRGSRLRQARRELSSNARTLDELLVVESSVSPFGVDDMLAMPEEVLRYRRGTPEDLEVLRAELVR